MFIESSAPRKTGDRATLVSELFQPTSSSRGRCLQFYRHMYGPHIGQLNVYTRVGSTDTKIWTESGNQGNSWIQSQVPVFSKQPFRVSHYVILFVFTFSIFFLLLERAVISSVEFST